MRRIMTVFALSSLFAAAPAFAGTRHHSGRSPKVARPVAGEAGKEVKPEGAGADSAKPEEKMPVKKKTKKVKKAEGATEAKPVEAAPAK